MATCRAQTSLQLPLALPDSSPHCLLGFLHFLKVYNSRDESYFKAPTATSKRREATSRGAWEFLISKLPTCRHYIIKCSIFFQFYAVSESAQKCALLRAKGIMVPRKHMRVRGYSICTRVCAQLPQHALRTQYSTLPYMLTTVCARCAAH